MERCRWCLCNEKMIKYHDEEWGMPLHDDRKQFEFLMMEAMQCGLNWNMMIQKREIFRKCFDGFDYEMEQRDIDIFAVSAYSTDYILVKRENEIDLFPTPCVWFPVYQSRRCILK